MWKDQVTNEKGCQIIQLFAQIRITEQVRRGQRYDTSEDQKYCAMIRNHFRRCTRKGVVHLINKQKICSKVAWTSGNKTKDSEKNEHRKEKMQSWDAQVAEGLGDYAEHHQASQRERSTREGRTPIKVHLSNKILPAMLKKRSGGRHKLVTKRGDTFRQSRERFIDKDGLVVFFRAL